MDTVAEAIMVGDMEQVKLVSGDDALLMSMGKAPELKRVYNFWTCELEFEPSTSSSSLAFTCVGSC